MPVADEILEIIGLHSRRDERQILGVTTKRPDGWERGTSGSPYGDSMSPSGNTADQGPLADPLPIARTHYRIEYVDRPASASEHRRHITGIATVASDGAKRHWDDIALVRDAIASGDEFYTQFACDTRFSPVESFDCDCGAATIRSSLDPPADHNLDNVAAAPFR